ncbi:MAG: AraC family transcriptional regulator [Bacteroidales bacterium]|nr:AraC family transcriptional regulator [Bacteroidales bacterium]
MEQISLELSFNNQDVFSKFFKRVTGISPSEYRRRF